MTALAEGAAQLHELFTAYLKAGFSRREALYLTGQLMAASAAKDQPPAS